MGTLHIHSQAPIELEDRTLAHLQRALEGMLRPGSAVILDLGDDRRFWLSANIACVFTYFGGSQPSINEDWVRAMQPRGLSDTVRLCPEPGPNSASPPTTDVSNAN